MPLVSILIVTVAIAVHGGGKVCTASIYIGIRHATSMVVVVGASAFVVYFESSRVHPLTFTAVVIIATTLLSARGPMAEW